MITNYMLEDDKGNEVDGPYDNYPEAKQEAQERELRVVEMKYEFVDSELVADFTPEKTHNDIFRTIWKMFAEAGVCDAIDGTEYQRVYKEWCADGDSEPIADFIKERANAPGKENDAAP